MGSKKRTAKAARKQSGSSKIPTWLYHKDVPISVKREVEDALARHAADNGLAVGSKKFNALSLQDICPSLKLVHARWGEVEPAMINTGTQPAMQALAAHLRDCKRKRKMMAQMVADAKAAGDKAQSEEQSSQSGAEEGEEEEEEEEAQVAESDGDRADQKPPYAKGDPRELEQAAGEEEGAATDGHKAPLIAQILDRVRDATEGTAECKSQAAQLRITPEDVVLWAEIGERCKRVEYYFTELNREEEEIEKLVARTPLRYSYRAVRDVLADSASQKSGKPEDE